MRLVRHNHIAIASFPGSSQIERQAMESWVEPRNKINEHIEHFCPLSLRYTGMWDAFRSIVRSDGILGLWKGWAPNCLRASVVCLGGEKGGVCR